MCVPFVPGCFLGGNENKARNEYFVHVPPISWRQICILCLHVCILWPQVSILCTRQLVSCMQIMAFLWPQIEMSFPELSNLCAYTYLVATNYYFLLTLYLFCCHKISKWNAPNPKMRAICLPWRANCSSTNQPFVIANHNFCVQVAPFSWLKFAREGHNLVFHRSQISIWCTRYTYVKAKISISWPQFSILWSQISILLQ